MNTRSPLIAAIAAMPLMTGAAHAAGSAGDWKEQYDTRLGFTISHPAGWTVQTQGYTIVVQSADHASLVLAEAFASKPGETAEAHVSSISAAHPSLFPKAHIERVTQQPSAGDEAVGALSYQGPQGKLGQARVLCSVFQQSGMLYAMAAPGTRFTAERSTLLRILKSLRFGPPPTTAASAHSPAKGGAVAGAGATGLHFVKWTDPKEHAFSVEVPQGWTVEGGAYRVESTDVRMMTRLTSPGKDMLVQVGDQGLPMFMPPTPFNMRMYGVPEGVLFSAHHTFQNMLLRYMPAPEFNKWYLDKALKQGIDDLSITKEQEMPEIARLHTEATNKTLPAGQHAEVTVAETDFKGRSKQTGKLITGALFSRVQLTSLQTAGPPVIQWSALPSIMGCDDDDKVEAHKKVVLTVLQHLQQSYQNDPAFVAKLNQQIAHDTGVIAQQANKAVEISKQRTTEIARNAEATRQSIMGSYWAKNAAHDDQQRQFTNYIGDKTDVNDPNTGESFKVGSGYSNYYRDPRSGTIIGTNSTDRPSVDLTPLNEF